MTTAPAISPSARRCHSGRMSTSWAPSATACTASRGVSRAKPRRDTSSISSTVVYLA